ncbi:MAG: thiamine pyrophosphate-binding protein [Microthrixaceae bacterium]|nr:thiamine pyrophosphate-binding protein [Microthrixaceae bacterium]
MRCAPLAHADTWPLQDLNQLDMVRPITKWARVCTTAARAGEYTAMGLAEARNGRPGPAYLEVPLDVMFADTPESTPITAAVAPAAPAPDPDALDAAAAALAAAERPIAIVGSGGHWSHAGGALRELAETVGLPVFSINAGRGVLPDTHEWSFGATLPFGSAFGEALMADVVLVLGARIGFTLLNGAFLRHKTVIRVDIDPAETGRNLPGTHNLVSDVRVFCETLARGWEGGVSPARAAWGDKLREAAQRNRASLVESHAGAADKPVHPFHLVSAIEDIAGPDATLVADGGDVMTWSAMAFTARGPGRLLSISTYLGCLGTGIPFALAAKLARPDEPVFLLEGDGSFGLNAMEFDTAVRHNLPFVCIVGNDGSWGMSRHGQGLMFGYDQHVGVDLGVRPYHEMVRALGGYGEFVDDAGELRRSHRPRPGIRPARMHQRGHRPGDLLTGHPGHGQLRVVLNPRAVLNPQALRHRDPHRDRKGGPGHLHPGSAAASFAGVCPHDRGPCCGLPRHVAPPDRSWVRIGCVEP